MSLRIGERGSHGRSQNPPPEGDLAQGGASGVEVVVVQKQEDGGEPTVLHGRAQSELVFGLSAQPASQSAGPVMAAPAAPSASSGPAPVVSAQSVEVSAAAGDNAAADAGGPPSPGDTDAGAPASSPPDLQAQPSVQNGPPLSAGNAPPTSPTVGPAPSGPVAIPDSVLKSLEQQGAVVGGPILSLIYKHSDAKVKVAGNADDKAKGTETVRQAPSRWTVAQAAPASEPGKPRQTEQAGP